MKQYFSFLLLLFFPLLIKAQLFDNFSDGDFSQNPTWSGETAKFQISTYSSSTWSTPPRLQLNGLSVADTAYLSTPSVMTDLNNKQWEFWVRLAFNTSKSNNCRVYLVSDNSNLEGSVNGYFIMLGDDNSDSQDSLSLWKQTGNTVQKLMTGATLFTGASASYRIKVIRDGSGNWSVYADPLGGINYSLQGTAFDNTYTSSTHFGFFCKYTSTNKTSFYFDDVYAGPEIVDITPPEVLSVSVISAYQLDVLFSENVEQSSAETASNYLVNGIGMPTTALRDASNASLVHLTFSQAFVQGTLYSIDIANVKDLNNNVMLPTNKTFSYYDGFPFDVVINEIMADPDPPVALPNFEYLELFNRTSIPISLKNWTITIGSTVHTFPETTIPADSFLILTTSSGVSALQPYGLCVGFSSFALTNTGNSVVLKNKNGDVIHFVNYSDTWYRDNAKKNGGWSLEQIDPNNPCGGAFNWMASVDNSGGTPGRKNSVFTSNPDTSKPYIKNIKIISPNTLEITFSEPIVSDKITLAANYFVNNGIGNPDNVVVSEPDKIKAVLTFSNSLQNELIYTLTFTDTIFDCAGNHAQNISKTFAIYTVKTFDVVINELMADPDPVVGLPNLEYVELFNRTDFPISLSGWKLILSTSEKTIPDVSIEPKGYLILSSVGSATLLSIYGNVAEVSGFSLTNTGQVVMLTNDAGKMISFVNYTDKWYQNSMKDDGGWSLEQIDPNNPCGEKNNWKASLDPSGGTPGRVNSVYADNPDNTPPVLVRASISRYAPSQVKIYFNEPIDSTTAKNVLKYAVNNGFGNPYMMKLFYPDNRIALLYFSQSFQPNIIYTLTASDSIFDCIGNKIAVNSSVRFSIPVLPDSADLVINEVLSDPKSGGVDFVEIYNRSTKILDFKDLYLASPGDPKNITNDNYLSFPGDYTVLTTDPDAVKAQYYTPNIYNFIAMPSFPSLNNDEGIVYLATNSDTIIDYFRYYKDLHFPLLTSTDGVSLERVNYNRPADDPTNWHSAAETVGFATPAYKNSQFSELEPDDGNVIISPEIFSPDNDGYNDLLNIYCKTDGPAKMLNIVIFDSKGRLVKNLVKNKLISSESVFTWDGTNENRQKANIGIYVVYVEMLDMKGNVKQYKKTAVLATKF